MSTGPVDFPAGARLEAVADGSVPPDLSAPGEAALAAWAAAARGPAAADELVGRDQALAAFTAASGSVSGRAVRPLVRAGVGVAALGLLFGGTAAAAYTGALPTPVQQFAHTLIGAPDTADHPAGDDDEQRFSADEDAEGTGPAVATAPAALPRSGQPSPAAPPKSLPTPAAGTAGSSAAGLCRAWTATGGQANPSSAVVRSLTALAGTAGQIPAYCTGVIAAAPPSDRPSDNPAKDKANAGSKANGNAHPHHKKPGQDTSTTGKKHKRHQPKKPPASQASSSPVPAMNNGHGAPPAHGPNS